MLRIYYRYRVRFLLWRAERAMRKSGEPCPVCGRFRHVSAH